MATKKRVAIVGGLRTPFVKSNSVFRHLSARDLGARVVSELLSRTGLPAKEVDQIVYGQVVPSVDAPNIAREVALMSPLGYGVDAYSVSRACATSTQAMVNAAQSILLGEADVVIAGGADSLSRPPVTYSDNVVGALMNANAAKDAMGKAKAFLDLRPKDLLPVAPAIKETSTGLTMGESAERMAKENGISREAQDQLALRSHKNAAKAWEDGVYNDEVMTVFVGKSLDKAVRRDAILRPDTTLEKLAKLRPAFDRHHGTLSAGNSSPLTDGASALILMSEKRAKALGFEVKAYLSSWAFATVDPNWQLLMAPYFAAPLAMKKAGLEVSDFDLIDMHEAFAAQVLSTTQAFASKAWAKKYLGQKDALGVVHDDILNVYGGSVALGHPFAATGTRQALTMANALHRRGGGKALITQCAAGGLGAAVVLEK